MKRKKKLLIVCHNVATGGIQKALINLLEEIKDQYEITLFLFSKHGSYEQQIPAPIRVIKANRFLKLLAISQREAKKEGLLLYALRALLVMWTKYKSHVLPIRLLLASERKLTGYDAAISYVQSPHDKAFYGGCNEFVLHNVTADMKIAFIHCDYLRYGGHTLKNKELYCQFDRIVTVSQSCQQHFQEAIPDLAARTSVIRNCHAYASIQQQAHALPVHYKANTFHVVTVARLSEEKGIVRVIPVISQLSKAGYRLCWHIIGDGPARQEIEQLIDHYALQQHIVLHGQQSNPYRYMTHADLLLVCSHHEAAPMVIEEAKCVGLPILTTKTMSAVEMVTASRAGWVCENTPASIKEKLMYIIEHQYELLPIRAHLKNQAYTNEESTHALAKLLGRAPV